MGARSASASEAVEYQGGTIVLAHVHPAIARGCEAGGLRRASATKFRHTAIAEGLTQDDHERTVSSSIDLADSEIVGLLLPCA